MKINKITLENIRSYQTQEIAFSKGSVLLSGDIGSGKSSILLAIDFVLFGLRSGSLSGGSLLRSGESKGSVELDFDLGGRNICIKRNLKRTADSVVQEPGYISINGDRKYLSPLEIKDKVLELLKYPKELLTKSKSLIYRYTVYTPQEEMKHILLGDKDNRLETLRKVFGIDKYKRIRDNCKTYIGHLKGLRKELAGKIADLEDKIKLRQDMGEQVDKLKAFMDGINESIKKFSVILEEKEKEVRIVEEKINFFKDLKKQLEILDFELGHKKDSVEKNNIELKDSKSKIEVLKQELVSEIKVDVKIINEKEKILKEKQKNISDKNALLGALDNRISHSKELKENISSLDVCPVCKQSVTKEHIQEVVSQEDKKVVDAERQKTALKEELKGISEEIFALEGEIRKLRKDQNLAESFALKKKILREKELLVERIQNDNAQLERELIIKEKERVELLENINKYKNVEERYKLVIDERLKIQNDLKTVELERAGKNSELISLLKTLSDIESEIDKKVGVKKELLYWTKIQGWLVDYFTPLMEVIERKILLKVHYDFDSLFQKWFGMLMPNDFIKITLDEEFTPVIEQNGHVIDYVYLSGGEKTAAALAYRLALNQVINNLMSVIETKDLLILDEPTDGFSDSQIDRMKDVLEELEMGQVILVSHEPKIESFVGQVMRLQKREHVSEVI